MIKAEEYLSPTKVNPNNEVIALDMIFRSMESHPLRDAQLKEMEKPADSWRHQELRWALI